MKLHEKLVELQKISNYFKKDEKGYKYNYVSGSSILARLKHKKDELGLILHPEIDHNTAKIESINDSYMFSANGHMIWTCGEEFLKVAWFFCGIQNDPSKAFGSALTYSERYFLLKFFGIPTDEIDPDKFQEEVNKLCLSGKAKAYQKEIINILRDMVTNNVDNFRIFERVKNSIIKHLGVEPTSMKKLPDAIKIVSDEEKLDKYSDHLVEVYTRWEENFENEKKGETDE